MYARVATWDGADAAALEEAAAGIRAQAEANEGPPEGVPAKEFMLLIDKEGGRSIAITLFETEDDYRQGDETLNSMSPPGGGMGRRASVDRFEVGARMEA